jgi:hypothetical protein
VEHSGSSREKNGINTLWKKGRTMRRYILQGVRPGSRQISSVKRLAAVTTFPVTVYSTRFSQPTPYPLSLSLSLFLSLSLSALPGAILQKQHTSQYAICSGKILILQQCCCWLLLVQGTREIFVNRCCKRVWNLSRLGRKGSFLFRFRRSSSLRRRQLWPWLSRTTWCWRLA